MYNLNGKVALVTGAAGEHGIGRAIARRLASEGADVVVTDLTRSGKTNWGGLDAVVAEIEQLGRRALAISGSVAVADDVERIFSTALEAFGQLDILVNNAAAPAGPDRVPVIDLSEEVWDQVQQVNVKGVFLCSRAAARHMVKRGSGKIINLSSTAGKRGVARYGAYCTSKFAVIGFTQSLAMELAPHRINVNAICPTLIDTERVYEIASGLKPDDMTSEAYRDQMLSSYAQTVPLGRVGQPDDVAQAAAYLASSESDFMTGLAINVTGGAWMS